MSTFVFGVLLIIGLVWGVPFVMSQLFGERSGRRVQTGLFLVLCVLLLAIVWFIYFADHDAQMAVIETVFGVWGWFPSLFKLVVGYLMIRLARANIVGGEGRVWRHLVEWPGYLLLGIGLLGLFGQLILTLITLVG